MPLTEEERSEILLSNIDTSDCGVIAIQALTGLGRRDALSVAVAAGYRPGHGTPRGKMREELRERGYELEEITDLYCETVATFTLSHDRGKYLLYIRTTTGSHVMALVEGDVYNARGCSGTPLEEAWRIK